MAVAQAHFNGVQMPAMIAGETFDRKFYWKNRDKTPVNLERLIGAHMQIRRNYNGELISNLTLENGKIKVNPADGMIRLLIPSSETINFVVGEWIYDLVLFFEPDVGDTDTVVYPFMSGQIDIKPMATTILLQGGN